MDSIIYGQNLTFRWFVFVFYEFKHLGSPDYLKIEKGNDFSFPLHLHQCFEIIIILSGEMEVTVDKKQYSLKEKEALIIFPNQIHSLSSIASEHVLCIFSPRLVQAYATGVKGKIPENSMFKVDSYLINAINNLNLDSSTTEKKGVLYSLCAQFDNTAEYRVRQKNNDTLLLKVFSFVENVGLSFPL